MKLNGKIGFIGGGQMGEALIKGMIQSQLVTSDQIMVAEPAAPRQEYLTATYNIRVDDTPTPLWTECDIIILAVKPQIMGKVLTDSTTVISNTPLIISIAAGIPLSFLDEKTGRQCRIIRVMPNTPALVLEAASAISPGPRATEEDLVTAVTIFNAIGTTVVLDESYLDAVTGLSGSGPAYVFSFIEALIDAGLKVGLPRQTAETLVLQTILGSVKLAITSKDHPAQLRASVTSPGGTTIAGLHELETAGFRGIIMNAVEAAATRSKELASEN